MSAKVMPAVLLALAFVALWRSQTPIAPESIHLPFPGEHVSVASLDFHHPRFSLLFPMSNYNGFADIQNLFSEREYAFFHATLLTVLARMKSQDRTQTSSCRVLDLGMNVGYTALLSHSLGCEVEGVEANPKTHAYLTENIRLNGAQKRIVANRAAVSRSSLRGSHVPFRVDGSGLTAHVDLSVVGAGGEGVVQVPVVNSVGARFTEPIMMKIDVEGFEFSALLAARHVLGRVPVVLFEWDPERMRLRDGADSAALYLKTLRDAGYEILHYHGSPAADEELLAPGFVEGDVLAVLKRFGPKRFGRQLNVQYQELIKAIEEKKRGKQAYTITS